MNTLLSTHTFPFLPPSLPVLLSQLWRARNSHFIGLSLLQAEVLEGKLSLSFHSFTHSFIFLSYFKKDLRPLLIRLNMFAEWIKACIYEWANEWVLSRPPSHPDLLNVSPSIIMTGVRRGQCWEQEALLLFEWGTPSWYINEHCIRSLDIYFWWVFSWS